MKVVVPCPLVDDFLGVVSWPPKGKKTAGQYIASWAPLEKNWTTYEVVKTLFQSGTREEADQVLKLSTDEDSSNEDSKFLAGGSIPFFKSEHFEIHFHSLPFGKRVFLQLFSHKVFIKLLDISIVDTIMSCNMNYFEI